MNWELYRDNMGLMYQVVIAKAMAEDGKEYTIYQELQEQYRTLLMPADKFGRVFHAVHGVSAEKEKYENAECKNEEYKYKDRQYEEQKGREHKNEEGRANDDLMLFLDAETVQEKLEVLRIIRTRMTDSVITSIEASLDIPSGGGDIEARLIAVKKTLQTLEKYEGRRLR